MTSTTAPWPRWAQLPGWLIRAPRLERLTFTVFGLATLTGLVLLATQGVGPVAYLALAITVTGAVLAHWWRWPGIALAAAGPVLSTLSAAPTTPSGVGSETVLVWSLLVFAAFYWALAGTRPIILGLVTGAGSALAFGLASPNHWLDPLVAAALTTSVAAAAAGSAISSQRRYLAEAEGRRHDAELTKEAEIERRIAEERVRIARDLHDMVGHQTAVVSMHLGAAELHLATDTSAVATDLAAARAGVQAVLRETQRILEVLRPAPGEESAVVPLADHSHLEALIDSFRNAGSAIEADLDDLPEDTAADVAAALYRTVQEALTNAQKHGRGTTRLHLAVRPPTITLTATNGLPPSGVSTPGGGYGLVGMRERVTAAGGTLATSSQDGTFRLTVELRTDGKKVR
ncbi:MAG: histidine kinase [Propionibacteriaceae bacterium]|nr:histidine kinase [Propionibacteriaceae bacterium]